MYVCAQIRHEPVRHGNIGLSDGGRIKGVAKDGIRDTVVDRANFGKYLREQPTAGMINPDQPTQHGHSPARGAPARYDDVGPRFNHKKVRNNITIPAGTPSRGKLKFDWGNKGVGTYTYQQKEGETPGDNVRGPGRARRGMVAWGAQGQSAAALGNRTCQSGPRHHWRRVDQRLGQGLQGERGDSVNGDAPTARRMRPCTWRPACTSGKEKTVLDKLFIRYGHFILASPRYHPELAGLGIEFCWGKAKWCFRRQVNEAPRARQPRQPVLQDVWLRGDMRRSAAFRARPQVCSPRARVPQAVRLVYHARERRGRAQGVQRWWRGRHGVHPREYIKLTNSLGESVQLGKAKKHANFYSVIEKLYTAARTHRNITDIEFAV